MNMVKFEEENDEMENDHQNLPSIHFSSVSNDDMENSINEESDNLPLTIDLTAINPNTHSVTPPLETPTFSYCRVPAISSNFNNDTSFTSNLNTRHPLPPVSFSHQTLQLSRPPTPPFPASLHIEMEDYSTSNSDVTNQHSTDIYEFPMKRKFSPPLPSNKRAARGNHSSIAFPASDSFTSYTALCTPHYLDQTPNHHSLTTTTATAATTFPPLPPFASSNQGPTILLQSSNVPDYFFYEGKISLNLFNIYDLLGNGVGAEVFQVEPCLLLSKEKTTKLYAMKKFKKLIRNQRQEDNLLKEMIILNQLNYLQCPNIPIFYITWKEDSFIYTILEYAEYGTLKQLLEYHQQKLFIITIPFIWHLINNVIRALQFIHHQGLVHLDIKSANLLIYDSCVIKVADFGLATKAGISMEDPEGDTRYLPLELLNSDERTYSADIFSFGILLYEVVHTMELDYSNDPNLIHRKELLPIQGTLWQKLRSGDFTLPDRIPMELSLLIRAMMNPIPSARPTASDILTLSDVQQIEGNPSLYLDSWKNVCFYQPRLMNRTASYDPSMNTSNR